MPFSEPMKKILGQLQNRSAGLLSFNSINVNPGMYHVTVKAMHIVQSEMKSASLAPFTVMAVLSKDEAQAVSAICQQAIPAKQFNAGSGDVLSFKFNAMSF